MEDPEGAEGRSGTERGVDRESGIHKGARQYLSEVNIM